jgi:putative DNA primase/helicase
MVALVRMADDSEGCCAHQTFIAADGSGEAPIDRARLFPKGAKLAGAGVWFGESSLDGEFLIAEGVESLLASLRLCHATSGCAALSTAGMARLVLPASARRVCVFADRDALQQGIAAARALAHRLRREGRQVRITQPTNIGDANDVWRDRLRRKADA